MLLCFQFSTLACVALSLVIPKTPRTPRRLAGLPPQEWSHAEFARENLRRLRWSRIRARQKSTCHLSSLGASGMSHTFFTTRCVFLDVGQSNKNHQNRDSKHKGKENSHQCNTFFGSIQSIYSFRVDEFCAWFELKGTICWRFNIAPNKYKQE